MRPAWRVAPAVALFLVVGTPQGAPAAPGPFTGMAGTWSGGGELTMTSGVREYLRCRAVYDVTAAGNHLRLELRCASDSYHFVLASDVKARGNAIAGSWTEVTRNAFGSISGHANGDHIQAVASGNTFSARLALSTRGNRQSVTIQPQGTEVAAVSVTLSKR